MRSRLKIIFETVTKIMENNRSGTGLAIGSGANPPSQQNNTGSMGIGSGTRSSTGLSTGPSNSSSNQRRSRPSNLDMMM